MPKKYTKKDKFADLDADFKDAIAGMTREEIRARIAQVALDQANLLIAKADDQDLKRAREAASVAGATYREGTKRNKLKIDFCHRVLTDKGAPTGAADESEAEDVAEVVSINS